MRKLLFWLAVSMFLVITFLVLYYLWLNPAGALTNTIVAEIITVGIISIFIISVYLNLPKSINS